jgi:hypothetical protein
MYNYKQYLLAKFNNSILIRYEKMCDALQKLLCMPVCIAGLHTTFKNAVSGIEKDIRNVTPRCVLEYSGVQLDVNACTANQAIVGMQGSNASGTFGKYARQYRRLPLNASFNMAIVLSDAAEAMRMSEYLSMLSFVFPHCKGDEHTPSTMIFGNNVNTQHDNDKNDYNLSSSLTLNMQILEPITMRDAFVDIDDQDDEEEVTEGEFDSQEFPLQGVGVQMPDGSWDLTEYGEVIKDAEGNPILDDDGNPLIGNYVDNGWYRLHHHIKLVTLDATGVLDNTSLFYDRPSGYEVKDAPEEVKQEIAQMIHCQQDKPQC